jgi:hypothetical protein
MITAELTAPAPSSPPAAAEVDGGGGWSWKIWLRLYSSRSAASHACSCEVMRSARGTSSIRRKSRQEAATVGSVGERVWSVGCGRDMVLVVRLELELESLWCVMLGLRACFGLSPG